jgi:hypothetical protein
MIFAGAIPRQCLEQAFRVVDLARFDAAYVCCSGSFRIEQALAAKCPSMALYSNDVSLLSTAIGRMATGSPLPFKFTADLVWLEAAVAGSSPMERIGAIGVALSLARFRGTSEFARAHMAHYRANIRHYLDVGTEKIAKYLETLKLRSFTCSDFREHAEAAVAKGGLILSWPPTIKNAYERDFRFVNKNSEWERPTYGVFDPAELGPWISTLKEQNANFCIFSDKKLEEHAPAALFTTGRAKRFYLYTSAAASSSLRRNGTKSEPFRYRVIDTDTLRADSRVSVVEVASDHMNFIKDKYQLPGLVHTDGLYRFFVFLDGQLAGGFVYSWMSGVSYRDPRVTKLGAIYLLSDFAASRKRKLSKLVAMLATGRASIQRFDRRFVKRTNVVVTSAFTPRPTSMKYRGIFQLLSRRTVGTPCLNYLSEVRESSNDAIYAEWWRRYAANAHRPGEAEDSPDAGG